MNTGSEIRHEQKFLEFAVLFPVQRRHVPRQFYALPLQFLIDRSILPFPDYRLHSRNGARVAVRKFIRIYALKQFFRMPGRRNKFLPLRLAVGNGPGQFPGRKQNRPKNAYAGKADKPQNSGATGKAAHINLPAA
jgi:hypothetical protein